MASVGTCQNEKQCVEDARTARAEAIVVGGDVLLPHTADAGAALRQTNSGNVLKPPAAEQMLRVFSDER